MSGLRGFEFRLLPSALALGVFAFLIGLGVWQLTRAAQKSELLASFDESEPPTQWQDLATAPERFARVFVAGRYDAQRQILMEGIARGGRPGYFVLTPLQTDSGDWLIVNRGWLPWQTSRKDVATPPAPEGPQRVAGRARGFARPGIVLGEGNAGGAATWPRLAVYPAAEEISAWLGEPVAETLLLLDPDAPGGFDRRWRPDSMRPSRHVGYAVQWFGLGVAFLIAFAFASRRPAGGKR